MNQNTTLLRAVESSARAEMDELRRCIDRQRDEALKTHLYAQLSEYRAIQFHAAQKLHEGGHAPAPNPLRSLQKAQPLRRHKKSPAAKGQADVAGTLLLCPTAATDVQALARRLLRTQRDTVRG